MSDFGWMLVCGLSLAAMGSAYLIDGRRWRRRAHLLALQAQAATAGIECGRRARKQQVAALLRDLDRTKEQLDTEQARADGFQEALSEIYQIVAKATGIDDGDWSRPVTVGDPEVDPLYAEISFCGPRHIAVYLRRRGPCPATGDVTRNGTCGIVLGGTGPQSLLATFGERESCLDSVGLAHVENVDQITEIIRAYNQSFHQAKGVADAGAIQEEKRGDRGRPGCDDHGA